MTAAICCVAAGAALFPKLMRQVPVELRGEYLLLLKMNPDKTQEQFTNARPFATFMSNRVVMAEGKIRMVDGLMRVRQKGTNVYMMSFQDKSNWLITEIPSPFQLVVLEPTGKDSKDATMFVVKPKPGTAGVTNSPPRKEPN